MYALVETENKSLVTINSIMKYIVEFKTLNNQTVTLAGNKKHFCSLSFRLHQIDSFKKKPAAVFNFCLKELAQQKTMFILNHLARALRH